MKRVLKKALISIMIVMLVSNFIMATPISPMYVSATEEENTPMFSGGIVGVFTWIPRALLMAVAMGLNTIVSALVVIGTGGAGPGGAAPDSDFFVTPLDVFFNRIELLDINFFDLSPSNDTVKQFRLSVASWYYAVRLIALMVLVVILIYIGIRMAISTIASEKAMYKKMLVDWACSLALLFLLHYIMIFVLECNTALVNAMGTVAVATDMTTFMNNLKDKAFSLVPSSAILSFASIGVYAMIVIQTVTFVFLYMKRMVTIGFLIIIAPLITITYSMDKIGDGKAQALNKWLKEFVYNILIQPFHCILYLSFAKVAMDLLSMDITAGDSSIATAVLAILCIQFVKTGEDILKNIFGIKADSLKSIADNTAMAIVAMKNASNIGQATGKFATKVGRGIANNEQVRNLSSAVSKAVSSKTKDFKDQVSKTTNKLSDANIARQASKRVDKGIDRKSAEFKTAQTEAINQIKQERKEKSEKREARNKKISGAVGKVSNKVSSGANKFKNSAAGKAVGMVAAVPIGLAKDAGKYMKNNAGEIVGFGIGTVLGAAGLSSGASGAVTGYGIGKGLGKELMSDSKRTVKKNLTGSAQAIANLEPQTDINTKIYETKALGDSGAFNDLSKKLDTLMENLNKLGLTDNNKNMFAFANVQKQLLQDPSKISRESIKAALSNGNSEEFNNLSVEQQNQAVELMVKDTEFRAQASLYKEIGNAQNIGYNLENIAGLIGAITPNVVMQQAPQQPNGPIDVDVSQVNVSDLTNSIIKEFNAEATSTITDINNKITEIEDLINQFNSLGEEQQRKIADSIAKQTGRDANFDSTAVLEHLRSQANALKNQNGGE